MLLKLEVATDRSRRDGCELSNLDRFAVFQ